MVSTLPGKRHQVPTTLPPNGFGTQVNNRPAPRQRSPAAPARVVAVTQKRATAASCRSWRSLQSGQWLPGRVPRASTWRRSGPSGAKQSSFIPRSMDTTVADPKHRCETATMSAKCGRGSEAAGPGRAPAWPTAGRQGTGCGQPGWPHRAARAGDRRAEPGGVAGADRDDGGECAVRLGRRPAGTKHWRPGHRQDHHSQRWECQKTWGRRLALLGLIDLADA